MLLSNISYHLAKKDKMWNQQLRCSCIFVCLIKGRISAFVVNSRSFSDDMSHDVISDLLGEISEAYWVVILYHNIRGFTFFFVVIRSKAKPE